jgi:hypothetical protein
MKKMIWPVVVALGFVSGIAVADQVRDWHDLDAVHTHVKQAQAEMNRARAANHYDMSGHGAKAEALLGQVEVELGLAVEAAKNNK